MSVVFDRPYEFVPRDSQNYWPWLIQRLRLVDRYLAKKEGVTAHETRHAERLEDAAGKGDGIILTPNHCRYADPLAMGWPGRITKLNFYAIASWHLFNKSWFDSFAMRKCGAFSLNREGSDRKSIATAIEVVATAERPLIIFPEGMTYRTNDIVRPFLDGLTLISRSAARRREKDSDGNVVIIPTAIKYLCQGDATEWIERQLDQLEHHFGWHKTIKSGDLASRTVRLCDAVLALNEIEYLGKATSGCADERRIRLSNQILEQTESRLGIEPTTSIDESENVTAERTRVIRTRIATGYFEPQCSVEEKRLLVDDATAAEVAQTLAAYSNDYLQCDDVTDTRVVETIQRLQEHLFGKADRTVPLKCIIEIGNAIEVPATKLRRGEADGVTVQARDQVREMLDRLAKEAKPLRS